MSARSLNKVMLIGNLTRDPELRYTPQGTAVCTFGLATNRQWTTADGAEPQEQVEYHRIVAWAKLAEICAQILTKGRKAYIEGRLQTRTWTGQDGQERSTTEVVAETMIALGPPKSGMPETDRVPAVEAGATPAAAPAPQGGDTSSATPDDSQPTIPPAKKGKKKAKPGNGEAESPDQVSEDDIPF